MNVLRLMTVMVMVLTSFFGALRGVSADGGTANGTDQLDGGCCIITPRKPDMRVEYVIVGPKSYPNHPGMRPVTVGLYNAGRATSNGFSVWYKTSNGAMINSRYVASMNQYGHLELPVVWAPSDCVQIIVDAGNTVNELDENNNATGCW